MTKEEFIERHIKVLWQDRKEASRKKMLSDTYDKIVGKEATKEDWQPGRTSLSGLIFNLWQTYMKYQKQSMP